MGLINLEIFPRTTHGKNANRRTRAAGRIPAVVYGKDRASEMVELDNHDFVRSVARLAGRSAIFNLESEGQTEESIALLREVQRNPVTDEVLHIDLMEIPRGVDVTVPVSIEVVGVPEAVKIGEGSVAQSLTTIDISCRPSQLPEYLEVDISELELNDKIFVKDIACPVGEIISDPEMLVLNIKPAIIVVEEEETEEGEEGTEEGAESEDEGSDEE